MTNLESILFIFFTLFCYQASSDQSAYQQIDPNTDFNKEHLKEDLSGVIDKAPEEMSARELQFHYFREHDYDGDETLDGNEIIMSIIHHGSHSNTDDGQPLPAHSDEQLGNLVDEVLKYQDKNNDGKITFQEYITPFEPETTEPSQ